MFAPAIWLAILTTVALQSGAASAQKSAGARQSACSARLKPLVIQVEFPDVPRKIESEFVRRRFLHEPDRYVREMSYGKACLEGEVAKNWYRMPLPTRRAVAG